MSILKRNQQKKKRRQMRVRAKLRNNTLPRVAVFRSLTSIYAQIIDDAQQVTLVSCSTQELDVKGDKKAQAQAVGVELAKRAKSKGIEQAKFDRGRFLYHGRVKALAEGLREGGMKI